MKITFFALALALMAVSAGAQDKSAALSSSTSVVINGKPIKGKVLEVDGKHFVAVEDMAQSLRGTISYGDGQIALTLAQPASGTAPSPEPQPLSVVAPSPAPQLPPPLVSAEVRETGRIKGTLTYFFSFQAGDKPDAGSKVWLVKGAAALPADKDFLGTETTLGTSDHPEQYSAVQYAVTDATGNFAWLDVPPGQYTLVMQSAHTKGTLNEKNHLFTKGNGRNPRDKNGRVESLNVVVKAGETVDASKDFGPNIDM